MIFIRTTLQKFENGKTLLVKHGGVFTEDDAYSGRVTLKMVMQTIVLDYTFRDGEAFFDVVKLPFFLTEVQVRDYLKKILEA